MWPSSNPWARNAGYTPPGGPVIGGGYGGGGFQRSGGGGVLPTQDTMTGAQCLAAFNAYYGANAADFATRRAALVAFGLLSPGCSGWVASQIAAEPSATAAQTDTQCTNAWDAFLQGKKAAGGMQYATQQAAFTAFAVANPACGTWAAAQIALLNTHTDTQAVLSVIQADANQTLSALGLTCAQWGAMLPDAKLAAVTPYVGSSTTDTPAALATRMDTLCGVTARSGITPTATPSTVSPFAIAGAAILAGLFMLRGSGRGKY